jgi:predicted glycosyltransferase
MPLPTEIAVPEAPEREHQLGNKKIWIDLDNSPHVPFFRPIIEEFEKRGCEVFITARDAYQVRELLGFYGIAGRVIGGHHGRFKLLKALGTISRALTLAAIVRQERPDISVAHGSRGCLLASRLLKIPHVTLADYEFTAKMPTIRPDWLMVPSVVPDNRLHMNGTRIMKYPGIKEDVYLSRFKPDQELKRRLGIAPAALLVTVRPPATEAHYHNPESEVLLEEALRRFVADAEAKIILLPRNKRQEADLRAPWQDAIHSGKIVIPEHVEDGMNLIWNSDLVISGGGTMNREAAAMGVPVYSIFRGKIGAVDQYLAEQGRLVMLESVEDVKTKIVAVRRQKSTQRAKESNAPALETIVHNLVSILESQSCERSSARRARLSR